MYLYIETTAVVYIVDNNNFFKTNYEILAKKKNVLVFHNFCEIEKVLEKNLSVIIDLFFIFIVFSATSGMFLEMLSLIIENLISGESSKPSTS